MAKPGYKHHILVCENLRDPGHPRGCCAEKNATELRSAFQMEIKKRELAGIVRANKSGCLDYCEQGPVVVVYPEGIWYSPKTADDVREIMESHIDQGKPVARLQFTIPDKE